MAVDSQVHISETWPQVGQLPRSLLVGETTVADIVRYVLASVEKTAAAVGFGFLTLSIMPIAT